MLSLENDERVRRWRPTSGQRELLEKFDTTDFAPNADTRNNVRLLPLLQRGLLTSKSKAGVALFRTSVRGRKVLKKVKTNPGYFPTVDEAGVIKGEITKIDLQARRRKVGGRPAKAAA